MTENTKSVMLLEKRVILSKAHFVSCRWLYETELFVGVLVDPILLCLDI